MSALTWTADAPAAPAGSLTAPPAHPETSAVCVSGYEPRPAEAGGEQGEDYPFRGRARRQRGNNQR